MWLVLIKNTCLHTKMAEWWCNDTSGNGFVHAACTCSHHFSGIWELRMLNGSYLKFLWMRFTNTFAWRTPTSSSLLYSVSEPNPTRSSEPVRGSFHNGHGDSLALGGLVWTHVDPLHSADKIFEHTRTDQADGKHNEWWCGRSGRVARIGAQSHGHRRRISWMAVPQGYYGRSHARLEPTHRPVYRSRGCNCCKCALSLSRCDSES